MANRGRLRLIENSPPPIPYSQFPIPHTNEHHRPRPPVQRLRRRQLRGLVLTELGHRQRRTVPPRPNLPERQSQHPERPADLGGVERRRLLAGPERGGVRLHRDWHPRNLAADRAGHRHRRSGQRDVPDRLPDSECRGRRAETPRREPVVGGPGWGRHGFEDRLPRRDAPTAQRAGANQAKASDLASVITLANGLRAALVEKGVIKGGV